MQACNLRFFFITNYDCVSNIVLGFRLQLGPSLGQDIAM